MNKIFIEQNSPESKVKVLVPLYEPLEVSNCQKCGEIIAEPKNCARALPTLLGLSLEQTTKEPAKYKHSLSVYFDTLRQLCSHYTR